MLITSIKSKDENEKDWLHFKDVEELVLRALKEDTVGRRVFRQNFLTNLL